MLPDADRTLPAQFGLRSFQQTGIQKIVSGCVTPRQGSDLFFDYKQRFGVVEAINANIRMLINRGRGYKNMRYLLLKAKRMAVTNTEYVAFQKTRKTA